ncbi:MAG: hypothetical protein PHH65_07785 [Eubacteriales bacterium]|jgi:hypothetical protein|nr:hypothetical protein [Eubacteriales bacterium]MDI9401384.1 hypothetical protein [Verrucomicrobiota bacterium]
MNETFQLSTVLAAGGGFDFFTLIGVSVFFILSFLAQKAQRAADKKRQQEENELGMDRSALDTEEAEFPDTETAMEAEPAAPQKEDLWGSFERQLREVLGEPHHRSSRSRPKPPPVEPTVDLMQEEPPPAPEPERIELPRRRMDTAGGTLAPRTPVLKRDIAVRKIAAAPKARGVGQVRSDLKSELAQLKVRVSEHVKGLGAKEMEMPVGSVSASRMEARDSRAHRLSRELKSSHGLQDYIVISAILGPPKALSMESDLYEKY